MSMTGGSLHSPIWVPYEIYMEVDFMYGWKAFNEKNGFTSAQGAMNIPELALYICYLYLVYMNAIRSKTAGEGSNPGLLAQRYVYGRPGIWAVVFGFTAAIMTLSKTILYGE